MSERAPLLFTKTGFICAAPPDFFGVLAKSFDAAVVDSRQIRHRIIKSGAPLNRTNLQVNVGQTAEQGVLTLLDEGQNVVYNGLLNYWNRRQHIVRQAQARKFGVLPILLRIETPLAVIEQRVVERYEQQSGRYDVPTPEDTMSAVHDMASRIEWPDQDTTGEHSLRLDGSCATDDLIERVKDYVASTALAATTEVRHLAHQPPSELASL